MKKSHCLSMFAGLASLVSVGALQAIPMYYTFEGQAGTVRDIHGILEDISTGDPLTYTFLMDQDVPSYVSSDGTVQEYGHFVTNHPSGRSTHRYSYHTEFVGGTGLIVDEYSPGFNSEYGTSQGSFGGYNRYDRQGEFGGPNDLVFFGGASNGSIVMYSYNEFALWDQGGYAGSINNNIRFHDDEGNEAFIYGSTLSLTSISDTLPTSSVPEPSTFLLMGVGLIGIGAARRKELFRR